jgi:hypothetical protein
MALRSSLASKNTWCSIVSKNASWTWSFAPTVNAHLSRRMFLYTAVSKNKTPTTYMIWGFDMAKIVLTVVVENPSFKHS